MTKKLDTILAAVAEHIGRPLTENEDQQARKLVALGDTDAENIAETLDLDEDEDQRSGSVVGAAYKAKYRERAANMARKPKDVAAKALARSCCDWLAVELARRTLTTDKKPKLVVEAFEAILDANGVKHGHWNRTTPGWQGRLRMTGRLALQRVVAEAGELALADGTTIAAPKVWVAKHAN